MPLSLEAAKPAEMHLPRRDDSECEACRGTRLSFWLEKSGDRFVRCRDCGLKFREKIPSSEDLFKFYEGAASNYYLHAPKMSIDQAIDHSERLDEIRPYRKLGRVLDVGCSTGGFLRPARKDGWECYGVDISPTVAEFCKKDGLNVFAGKLVDSHYPDEYFDVVRCWASLEHVTDPFLCLKEAKRILRKGGLLLFSVPNGNCLIFALLKEKYRYICSEHLYYYSKKSIQRILQRADFPPAKRLFSDTFDVFSFLEDWQGISYDSTAQAQQKERDFVQTAKQRWYHRPLQWAYRNFRWGLKQAGLGDIWFVYVEKS